MIRVGESGRTLHMQVIAGLDSPADPICGMMDSADDAMLIAWLVNRWLKDPEHVHFFTIRSSPAGAWLQCACGQVKQHVEGQEVKIGPDEQS